MSQNRKALIRALNDSFRTTFIGGHVVMTAGVQALPEAVITAALSNVRSDTAFDEGNDPYGEHDFGHFVINGYKFFWKIDYFDCQLAYHSEDPSQPEKTTRVLTLMLAKEY